MLQPDRMFLIFALVLVSGACTDNPIAPPPSDDVPSPPIASFTEWFASEPENRQGGEFTYNGAGQLIEYDFWHNNTSSGERVTTLRVRFTWQDDRLTELVQEIRPPGEEWYANRIVHYDHDASGRIHRARIETLHERTGEVQLQTRSYSYTENGSIRQEVIDDSEGTQVLDYTYDAARNVERIDSRHFSHLILTFDHDNSVVNPFRFLPPASGINILSVPDRFSRHMSIDRATRAAGASEPASRGTAVIDVDDEGLPARRAWTLWNTADPETQIEVVAEYEYY